MNKTPILTLALVTLFFSLVSAQNLWILSDTDYDFAPPHNDILTVYMNADSNVLTLDGFFTNTAVGCYRRLAVYPDGQHCWVSEDIPSNSTKLVGLDGQIDIEIRKAIGAIHLGNDNLVYFLTSQGTIYGDSLLVYDSNGNYIAGTAYSGFDLLVDDKRGNIWIVGNDIKKLNKNLELEFRIEPIGWLASSIDLAKDGSVWVAERMHSATQDTRDRIHHIGTDGSILESADCPGSPMVIRVDNSNNLIWVGTLTGLYLYDPGQSTWQKIDDGRCNDLEVDRTNNLVWVTTEQDVRSFSLEGELQTTINTGIGDKWIALPTTIPTTISAQAPERPVTFSLAQNYPNPFNPKTTISFTLPQRAFVTLKIYNMMGKEITTLVSAQLGSGEHRISWDALDFAGGIYLYQLKVNDQIETGKMVLLK